MTSRAADFRRSSAPPLDEQLGAKQHERTNLIAYRHGLRASEVAGVEVSQDGERR